jgi:hypothetical protein
MPTKKQILNWIAVFVLIAFCAGVPLSWVFVPLITLGWNRKLCDSIAPDIQAVAEKPVNCCAGYQGVRITTSETDYEQVCHRAQEMIRSGRIGCSVRIETDTSSKSVDFP